MTIHYLQRKRRVPVPKEKVDVAKILKDAIAKRERESGAFGAVFG